MLERRCDFKNISDKGKEIRRFLFDRGFVTSERERSMILKEAEDVFRDELYKAGVARIEDLMFCDLEEEKILCAVQNVEPEELIKEYNLSLTQTLLFNAVEMTFTASDNYQEIFRRIKYLGLMYEIDDSKDEKEINITGPTALFKKTRRYGTSFAKLLPTIIKAKEWDIRAKIEMKNDNRVYEFGLSSSNRDLFPSR